MERVVCLLIGYVLGHIQTAVMYCKMKGVDIRSVGSGNAGTTNTLRVMGPKAGFIVLLGDMFKCMIAILISWLLFGRKNPDYMILYMTYTAAGCVLGHDYPLHLHFKGGKGIACTAGYTIYLSILYSPLFFLMGLVSFFLPLNIFHIVSVCSLFYYTCLFIMVIVFGQMGQAGTIAGFSLTGAVLPQGILIEVYVILFLLTALAYFQHRGNIKKLLQGKERKTYIFKKNKVD